MIRSTRSAAFAMVILSGLPVATILAQPPSPRDIRIEVRDKSGKPISDALVTFFLTGDSTRTDSTGVAKATVLADTAINISVRKVGFEQRNARFVIGRAPAFNVKVAMGEAGQRLPEVEVKDSYPGEPWRPGFEQRKKRGGGQFRDLSSFAGAPFTLQDWFSGVQGVRTGGGIDEIAVPRCRNLGVFIDNQHATSPNNNARSALRGLPAQDIAAIELYVSNPPAQFTGQFEDCSLLIWTRLR